MPKNEVSDLITDQEIAFALLVISGTMTDQRAAEAVGLNPNIAAYTKSKPCVRAYMLEHRARMQQQLAGQETVPCFHLGREQVLDRLWELANIGPEVTRGSLSGQVKALSMIVAIEGLIPDRRAGSAGKNPALPPTKPQIYAGPRPNPALAEEEDGLGVPETEPALGPAPDAPTDPGSILNPGESTFVDGSSLTETQYPPYAAFPPDTRVPFSIAKNPFARRR